MKNTVTNAEKLFLASYSDKGKDVIRGGYNVIPIKSLYVDSEPEPSNIGINMLDEDMSTRWTTYTDGAAAIFDLETVQSFDAVAAAFWNGSGRVYSFGLYASEDGENYSYIKDFKSCGISEDYEIFRFDETKARYIKVIGKGNTVNSNTNIIEFNVLKTKEVNAK